MAALIREQTLGEEIANAISHGLGCLLALGWELGEWYTFIRHGTELDTAYEDTLGDLTLGSCGAFLASLVVARVSRPTVREGHPR